MIYLHDGTGLWVGIPHNLSPGDSGILTTVAYHPPNERFVERYSCRNDREANSPHHSQKKNQEDEHYY